MGKNVLVLCALFLSILPACGQEEGMQPPALSQPPTVSEPAQSSSQNEKDRPTVPANVAEGTEYLYDFRFSQRYDARVTEEFGVAFPDTDRTRYLFEQYADGQDGVMGQVLAGEGMTPHSYKKYWDSSQQGEWVIVTDYYEPDDVEYISYIWTTLEGAATNRKIGVGSTEAELLNAYQTELYYLEAGETEASYFAKNEEGELSKVFDHAYAWQPFTEETNDIRDITFYIKEGKVVAIEMIEPYELRYVYGYDREAGLNCTQQQRENK